MENYIYFLPILIGVIAGVMVGFWVGQFVNRRYIYHSVEDHKSLVFGNVFGVLATPFVCYFGWVVGGNFGGAYVEMFVGYLIPAGIGAGIFIVEVILIFLAIVIGGGVGKLAERRQGRNAA